MTRRVKQNETGAAALIVAVLGIVVFGMLAFVTDLGLAYVHKQRVQNGADSAALAVAQEIARTAEPDQNCAEIAATMAGLPMREGFAEPYFAQNVSQDASLADGATGFAIGCDTETGLVTVEVAGKQSSPMFFGGVFGGGEDGIAVAQSAISVVGPAGAVTGVRPFAICQALANQLLANPSGSLTIPFDNSDTGCGSASGNWGVLDLDGGSNGTSDLAAWVATGYDQPISTDPPVLIPGDPGAPPPGALTAAMDSILDDEIVLPVFDTVSGTGSGSQFHITGFIGVKLCGWKFKNKSGDDTGLDEVQSGACFTPVSAPVPKDYLQVQYRRLIPVGEVNRACSLGDTTCDHGLRVFGMAG